MAISIADYHNDEENREIGVSPTPIPIEIGSDTHLVSVASTVERRRIDGCNATLEGISLSPGNLWNSPEEAAIMSAGQGCLKLELKF